MRTKTYNSRDFLAELHRAAQFASGFDKLSDHVMITDSDGVILYANEAAARTTGYSVEEMVGKTPGELWGKQMDEAFYRNMWQVIKIDKKTFVGEIKNKKKDGTFYDAEIRIYPILNQDGEASLFVSIQPDISDRINNERVRIESLEKLRRYAFHDKLTGLPNRRLFEDRVRARISNASRHPSRKFAIASLDLDRFKDINDVYGHETGDKVLKETARRIRACIRAEDTAARMGGDEFVILFHEINQVADAEKIANKIRRQVSSPMELDSKKILISCSIGVAAYPEGGKDRNALLKSSDDALYMEKNLKEKKRAA